MATKTPSERREQQESGCRDRGDSQTAAFLDDLLCAERRQRRSPEGREKDHTVVQANVEEGKRGQRIGESGRPSIRRDAKGDQKQERPLLAPLREEESHDREGP